MSSFRSVQLLEPAADHGYPVEYLLSRVRGRRSRLLKDWRRAAFDPSLAESVVSARTGEEAFERSPEAIWRNLLREHRWLAGQMNADLYVWFAPYFLYAELRTLFIGLRHIRDHKAEGASALLSVSLLSAEVKRVLSSSETIEDAVSRLGSLFRSRSVDTGDLNQRLAAGGLRGVEQHIADRILSAIMAEPLDPEMRGFFVQVIDARNILALYKALRLNTTQTPLFIAGGRMAADRLRGILLNGDIISVEGPLREVTGFRVDSPDISPVEISLYKGITRSLRKSGRDPLGTGLLLDYLWRRSVEAMNLSVLAHCRDLERDAVQAELVH